MRHDPWLISVSPTDIEAAMQRKAAREALIAEQAAEITRLRAELATARCNDMGDAWIAQKHAWQEAVEDALLQWCSAPSDDETPKDALRRLVQYEITAALDPAVSQAAADLVATARRDGMEGFGDLVAAAHVEATKAMQKYPQPNYVISKIAEEAGEVVKAAIHCAEKRETTENVAGEMKQLIAMLIRLWIEGDQVHGLPPIAAAIRAAAGDVK